MKTSFYSDEELADLGLCTYGENVLISRKCSIYSPSTLSIGSNVRIDDFCILSGKITIGSNVHISAYVAFYGSEGIYLSDYTGISARTTLYSAVDDFSGDYLIGPLSPKGTTHLQKGSIFMEAYTQVGASSVLMPGVTIAEGAVIGAMSFVNNSVDKWSINAGIPCRQIKKRKNGLLNFLT